MTCYGVTTCWGHEIDLFVCLLASLLLVLKGEGLISSRLRGKESMTGRTTDQRKICLPDQHRVRSVVLGERAV